MTKDNDIQPGIDPKTGFIIATGESVGPRHSLDASDEGPRSLSNADIGALMARTMRGSTTTSGPDVSTEAAPKRSPRPEGMF